MKRDSWLKNQTVIAVDGLLHTRNNNGEHHNKLFSIYSKYFYYYFHFHTNLRGYDSPSYQLPNRLSIGWARDGILHGSGAEFWTPLHSLWSLICDYWSVSHSVCLKPWLGTPGQAVSTITSPLFRSRVASHVQGHNSSSGSEKKKVKVQAEWRWPLLAHKISSYRSKSRSRDWRSIKSYIQVIVILIPQGQYSK